MFGKRTKLNYEAVDNDDVSIKELNAKPWTVFTPSCIWTSSFTAVLIGTYYIPSICLTFYQRWLYQNFHFPLITVLVHMVVKYILATLIRVVLIGQQRKQRILLNWKEYILAIAPVGIFSGLDIGLSNWGLELIQISLYTMTKSTTIVFILAFSIFLKLERKSWSLCFIVVMITTGLMLFTYKATQFNLLGFILLLLASISSGVRWTCVQLLLQKSKMGMKNPIDMIYHMQPWMIVSILPFAIWMESNSLIINCQLFRFTDYSIFFYTIFKILIGAFIAFFMELAEVMVITYTSSLTLAIAGIFKEVFVLVLAVEWNGDEMSAINVIGLLICLCGITCHVIHKMTNTPSRLTERSYDDDNEHVELGENLIVENDIDIGVSSESDESRSDTQVLFDILNRHDR